MHDFLKEMPRAWKRSVLLSTDMFFVAVSLWLVICLEAKSFWPNEELIQHWGLFPIAMVVGALVSVALGLPSIKLNAFEVSAALRTAVFATVLPLFLAAIVGMAETGFPVSVFIPFGFMLFGLSVASRVIGLQLLLWIYRRGQIRTRVLIYGAGATGVQLVAAIGQSEDIQPMGFLDDNKTLQGVIVAGLPVYAPARVQSLVIDLKIDRVVLAMPSVSAPRQAQIVRRLAKVGCDVHRLPSFSELIGNRELVEKLEPVHPSEYLGRDILHPELPGMSETYAGKSVLVTGAGGSIGSEMCRQLLGCRPARLILLDHSEAALYTVDSEMNTLCEDTGISVTPVLGSTLDRRLLDRVMAEHKVEIVLHAAAYKHVPMVQHNMIEGLRNNVLGTKTLADAAKDAGVKRFVLISTDKAVRPTNVMGASKRLAELVIQDLASRASNTLFSMVRFGNVLGSSGSVIPLFQEQIARGGPITLTDNEVTRFFMTASEAARLVLLAGGFARGGDVFVLDMGKPVRIRKLAAQMIERAGYTVRDADNPDGDIEIKITGLRPGEKLYEELLIGADMQTTPHGKILRAKEESLSEIEVANMLRDLRTAIETGSNIAALDLIERWVVGYSQPRNIGTR